MNQQALAFDITERNVRDVWQASIAVAIENDCFNLCLHFVFKFVAQPARIFISLIHFRAREFCRRAESHQVGDGLSSRAPLSFLVPADLLRKQTHTATNKERARSLWRINFVS